MEILLHIGAHRTGTTTFQRAMKQNSDALEAKNIAYWGPQVTRKGLFDGIIPNPTHWRGKRNLQERGEGRVQLQLEQLRGEGCQTLVISEENLLGSIRTNLREEELYPAAGERMARYFRAFDGQVKRVVLMIRSLDRFWASSCAFLVARGHTVPGLRKQDRLVSARRSWRDVITDIACAMPDVELRVMPFESHYANPQTVLRDGLLLDHKLEGKVEWSNRAPDIHSLRRILAERGQDPDQIEDGSGIWQPFNDAEVAQLKERYSEDLFWLTAGADGLATLTTEFQAAGRGTAHHAASPRGHDNDEKGQLEGAG